MKIRDFCPIPLLPSLVLPEEVFIEPEAICHVPHLMKRFLGTAVLAVADSNTLEACKQTGHASFLDDTAIEIHILPNDVHPEMEVVDEIEAHCIGITGLLAIGGGTINDLVKMAAYKMGLPYIVLGTGASMNGYASSIGAMIEDGLKTTQEALPPKAIVLDINILKAAPPELMRAGVGDLLSKPVSTADYWLGGEMEECEYLTAPGKIANHAVDSVMRQIEGIANGDDDAYFTLAKALVLSGVSMVAAGSSSPASGGEHLISHLWDMQALTESKPMHLHGAQVGVATCISAAIYQRLLTIENPSCCEIPAWESEEERIKQAHGALAGVVLPQAKIKHDRWKQRLQILQSRWKDIRKGLRKMNIPKPEWFHDILQTVGAPDTLAAMDQTRESGIQSLRIARDIRSRYTVLDLAFELGVLPTHAEAVLEESGVLQLS